jgi:choline dehydrogenase-like flavoprotein
MDKFDVCIIGSGAGGAPLALDLCRKGMSVLLLERGGELDLRGLFKDELRFSRRSLCTPSGIQGQRYLHYGSADPFWASHLWGGALAGGGTRIMSGYFLPMPDEDFLPSRRNIPRDATARDWPLDKKSLDPYYSRAMELIGIAGRGSWPDLDGHGAQQFLDRACSLRELPLFSLPRAIRPEPTDGGGGCSYSGLCGGYPCFTGAKGDVYHRCIIPALDTGNLTFRTNTCVRKILYRGSAVYAVECVGPTGITTFSADTYVVAAGAIETARLLLHSRIPDASQMIGRNLGFTVPCEVTGCFSPDIVPPPAAGTSHFINRYTTAFNTLSAPNLTYGRGGTVIFQLPHPNPVNRALALSYDRGRRIFGAELEAAIDRYYSYSHISTDVFIDYLPSKRTCIRLSDKKDNLGIPCAEVHYGLHEQSRRAHGEMARRLEQLFYSLGAEKVEPPLGFYTAGEQQHGTCRFGEDSHSSVCTPNGRVWNMDNLYVSDSSLFPSGISVPSTLSIIALSLRLGEHLGG